eukprot:1536536-Amphidinium_carterae.1
MGPKAKGKAKPKVAASSTPAVGEKRTRAGDTFAKAELQTLPSTDAAESKKRRLVRRDTEELTKKCLRDNFKELDDVAKYSQPSSSSGLTLYETVLRDKREKRRNPKSKLKFGLHYFCKLRSEFSHCIAPMKRSLIVKDVNEETWNAKDSLKPPFSKYISL